MFSQIEGRVCGVSDESWGEGEKAGRRVLLFVQQHPDGLAAPTEIRMQREHYASVKALTYGVYVSLPVSVRAFAKNGMGSLACTSAGPVQSAAAAAK